MEFVFLNLRLTVGEDLLPLSVQKRSVRVQCLAPDLFPQQVSLFFQQRVSRSFGHGRRRLTNRQAFSLGVIDMFSVCVIKHLLERGVIVIHILEEPLLGELLLGQGLCEGLDISLHEVVVFGLITCVGVGFVRRPISLLAEYTVLLSILVEVEGQQELLEIEGD